jgi:hypothetical protein
LAGVLISLIGLGILGLLIWVMGWIILLAIGIAVGLTALLIWALTLIFDD